MNRWFAALLLLALVSCGQGRLQPTPPDAPLAACVRVGEVPDDIRRDFLLDPFYRRHVDAMGLPILSSGAPDDAALLRACGLLVGMLSERPDVLSKLIELRARFVVIGRDEGTADVPEYGFRDESQEVRDTINARARGIGGQASSCGEENLMCLPGDRYAGESICVHEFAHTIREGVHQLDPGFTPRLAAAFEAAVVSGLLDGSYRSENLDEYWAEGVQDWFNANAPGDSLTENDEAVSAQHALRTADPDLHVLIGEVFPEVSVWDYCYAR